MKVLIAEDDKVSRMTLSACLRGWGYETVAVENGRAAFDALVEEDGPRLALLDWEMPEMDGIDVCTRLRSTPELPFRYIILLTGRDSEEDIVAALNAGADDYITKPWTPGELRARLGVGRRMVEMQEQIEENARRLALAAQTDYLTQIWNRSAVLKRMREELERAKRSNLHIGTIMLDVDHFKQVNDTYGHAAGDDVLREIARRLCSACRTYDIVGRYGGEEFLAVTSNTDFEETRSLAERFRKTMAETPIQTEGTELVVTISLGAIWVKNGMDGDVEAIVKKADAALYRAKEAGRNRVEIEPYEGA
jgi:diguanylate cyclase (GGDEF)-like protein